MLLDRRSEFGRALVAVSSIAVLSALAILVPHAEAGAGVAGWPPAHDCGWLTPVDAPIVDPFRPPEHPFAGGGNRGLEFGTVGSESVAAVAAGRVTFAGPVGGERWLVVTHPGGLRSTYGPLESIVTIKGQSVGAGAELGTAAPGLHLTARLADRYLDPAPLLDGRCGRARLVPSPGSSRAVPHRLAMFGGGDPVH